VEGVEERSLSGGQASTADAYPSAIESSFNGPPPHELRSQGGA